MESPSEWSVGYLGLVLLQWPRDFSARTWYAEAFGDLENVPPWGPSGT
ncbi:hypothetical protein GCM10009736_68690 [Actinomadura bangladeshensis]